MQITLLTGSQARGVLHQALGGDPAPYDVAADLLRHEACARRRCARHLLIARVHRLAAPAIDLDPELVSDVCEDLERQGDVVLAEGGFVYPAPTRIVALGSGVFRFVCAVPSARLVAAVEGEWTRRGARRDCRLRSSAEHAAEAFGGIVVSPEVWAGLDRSAAADEGWLRTLDARLDWAPEPAGSLEHEEPLEWSGFAVDQDEPRWRASGPAQLWRARHRWRRWVYVWTAGGSPGTQAFVTLYPDEGSRTVYAVARVARKPFRGSVAKSGSDATLHVNGWLPQAEYRYLATCGDQVDTTGRGSDWIIPEARLEAALKTLAARLGLQMDGQGT